MIFVNVPIMTFRSLIIDSNCLSSIVSDSCSSSSQYSVSSASFNAILSIEDVVLPSSV